MGQLGNQMNGGSRKQELACLPEDGRDIVARLKAGTDLSFFSNLISFLSFVCPFGATQQQVQHLL